jgi:6-pyruvoyltetrahydropterin/6-carboxytetrahydropterin synthase
MADAVPRFIAHTPPPGEVAVTRARAFEAAHRYGRRAEDAGRYGKASRIHGHNFVVAATIAGPIDSATGFVADFRALDAILEDALAPLDHRRLDTEYAPLADREPSTEALAEVLFATLAPRVRNALDARLARVRVAESDALWSERDERGDVELTRAFEFSAAHRLADPDRSDEENRRLYGKCANPQPHGHAYRFEVTVRGEPDRETGLIADVGAIDDAVRCRVLDSFDHRYLNVEVPPFDRVLPTAERIAERIWGLLAKDIPGLARVVVYETPRSAFAYTGPEPR